MLGDRIRVSPSCLGLESDYSKFVIFFRQINKLADSVHIDMGDGSFISKESEHDLLLKIKDQTLLPKEIHLMVHAIPRFLDLINQQITVNREHVWVIIHPEANSYSERLFDLIRADGFRCGLALKPQTPLTMISNKLLSELDLIVVMTVEPGISGQAMLEESLQKVADLVYLRDEYNGHFKIEVDGGIGRETAQKAVDAGADILVSGKFVQDKPERIKALKQLRKI